jgi:uracil-DNA glycosylase
MIEQRRLRFGAIMAEAAACRLCPALCERRAVLSERNGSIEARVMVIGEAPGRQGGDRTRVPFSGDQSGRNFGRFIASVNLTRIEYHNLSLKEAAGKVHQWNGRWLVPVYHPSPQVLASHRREAAQLQDYRGIARALKCAGLQEKMRRHEARKR